MNIVNIKKREKKAAKKFVDEIQRKTEKKEKKSFIELRNERHRSGSMDPSAISVCTPYMLEGEMTGWIKLNTTKAQKDGAVFPIRGSIILMIPGERSKRRKTREAVDPPDDDRLLLQGICKTLLVNLRDVDRKQERKKENKIDQPFDEFTEDIRWCTNDRDGWRGPWILVGPLGSTKHIR